MVRTIAPLVYHNRVDETHIQIGTGSWQLWLSKNSRFRYESFWGSFIACKEQRGEEIVWIAYRQFKEELRRADLGSSKDLTVNKLVDTAKELTVNDTNPWEGNSKKKKTFNTSSPKLEVIPKAKEIEMNAVRQWCILYTHPDGRVEFLGACWEKEQALTQIQNFLNQAPYSEAVGDLYRGTSDRYELREELVMPSGYTQKRSELSRFDARTTTKETELIEEVSQLRHQLSDLQKQLDRERSLNSKNDTSVKFIWN